MPVNSAQLFVRARPVAYILMLQGRANEAIDECKFEAESGSAICLALVYHADGREKDSEPALDQAIRGRPATSPCSIADAFA
jgi:hypothetical protein